MRTVSDRDKTVALVLAICAILMVIANVIHKKEVAQYCAIHPKEASTIYVQTETYGIVDFHVLATYDQCVTDANASLELWKLPAVTILASSVISFAVVGLLVLAAKGVGRFSEWRESKSQR